MNLSLRLTLLFLVASFALAMNTHAAPPLNCKSQKECDLQFLSGKLVEAGLPSTPAKIVGHTFCCSSSGGGNVWCGTVGGLNYTDTWSVFNLSLKVSRGKEEVEVSYDFSIRKWKVSETAVDWGDIVEVE